MYVQLLLKFGVPDEQIDKLTRWHRIAMVRKFSSEQAASGITIDEIPVSKFARGQRMSFMQLQQQTKEKCQEIWDRQVQSLSAIDGDDNGSDTEAHSDLDSFAGDLENLLDAEEFDDEDVGTADLRSDKGDGMRGLKMRKCSTQAQFNEENQDNQAEAALVKKLLEESGNDTKRKKQPVEMTKQGKAGQMIKSSGYVSALTPKESTPRGAKEVDNSFTEGGLPSKLKTKLMVDANDIILVKKKNVLGKDGLKAATSMEPANMHATQQATFMEPANLHAMQPATSLLNEKMKSADAVRMDVEKVKPPPIIPCFKCHQVPGTMNENCLDDLGSYQCSGCGEIRVLFEPPSDESSGSGSDYKCSDDESHGSDPDAGLKIREFVKSIHGTSDM